MTSSRKASANTRQANKMATGIRPNAKDSRQEFLLPYIKNKTVLDLGAGDMRDRSLHPFIASHAKRAVGMELYQERIDQHKGLGYDLRQGNAESTYLGERFDVVVAGDIIEHVDNVGMFIDNALRHVKPGGVFIFNTPNIYSINLLLRGLVLGHVEFLGEHTVGLNEQLIRELLTRRGMKPEKLVYFTHKNTNLAGVAVRALASLRREWHENIIVVVRKR